MRAVDRIWIATAVAGVFGAMTLLPLTADNSYLFPSWLLIAVPQRGQYGTTLSP